MKNSLKKFKSLLFPKIEPETSQKLNVININNIFNVTFIIGLLQTVALIVYLIMRYDSLGDVNVYSLAISFGTCVILCAVFFAGTLILKKNKWEVVNAHPGIAKLFVALFLIFLIAWGMAASIRSFIFGQQMLSFYIVIFIAVVFIRISPFKTIIMIVVSFAVQFFIISRFSEQPKINIYNFFMMAFVLCVGAVMKYYLTVDNINQVNITKELNKSLDVIARHDSMTRLQNRYSLNQSISSSYIGKDICLAIGDINDFKGINDKLGHRAGDIVLKQFADILLEIFGHDSVYRYGGDEFLVVIRSDDLDYFKDKLSEANKKFADCSILEGKASFGCSFGSITAHPETPSDFSDLLVQADKKLYAEKAKIKKNSQN